MFAEQLVGEERGWAACSGAEQRDTPPGRCPWWPARAISQPPSQHGRQVLPISLHQQQNMPWGGHRNLHSLYTNPLIFITFSRKILSPSRDTLRYVDETTSIKWTLLFCKEAFNSYVDIFTRKVPLWTLASTTSSHGDTSSLLKSPILETNVTAWGEQDFEDDPHVNRHGKCLQKNSFFKAKVLTNHFNLYFFF